MELTINRQQALELLKKYNQEPFHIQHGLTVEGVMRWYAQELGYQVSIIDKVIDGGTEISSTRVREAVENAAEYAPGCPESTDCGDFTSAVHAAAAAAEPGDVVLMSPASAAFDQFKNFMVRGDYYKKLVREL